MTTLTRLITVYLPLQTADNGRASEEMVNRYCRRWTLSYARKELVRCVYSQSIGPMNWRRLYADPTPGCTSYVVDPISESQCSHAWDDIHRYLGNVVIDPQDLTAFLTALDGIIRWQAIEGVARWERRRFGSMDA